MSSLEFTHAGQNYKAGKLDAMRQFHVMRRLAPLLPELAGAGLKPGGDPLAILEPLARIVSTMQDADVEYVLNSCMAVVERQQSGGAWAKIQAAPGALMFPDIDMAAMLAIAWQVLQHNLSGFFAGLPQGSPGEVRT
jgi:hypothetical protein